MAEPHPVIEAWRELAWSAAASLGASASVPGTIATCIDPEALLVLGRVIGDVRLEETLASWAGSMAPLLMGSRLRRIASETGVAGDGAMPVVAEDRHRAVSVPRTDRPSALALQLRAIAGSTSRTELLRALHECARHGGTIDRAEAVRRAAVARGQVYEALAQLELAGALERGGSERRQTLRPRHGRCAGASLVDAMSAVPWAAWRDAVGPAAVARELVDGLRGGAPRTDVAAALERLRACVRDLAERGGPELAIPTGPPLDVAAAVIDDQVVKISAWWVEHLRDGRPA